MSSQLVGSQLVGSSGGSSGEGSGGELEVVDLQSGMAWDSVTAAARAMGVDCETVRAWIADPVKAIIVRRPCCPCPVVAATKRT